MRKECVLESVAAIRFSVSKRLEDWVHNPQPGRGTGAHDCDLGFQQGGSLRPDSRMVPGEGCGVGLRV